MEEDRKKLIDEAIISDLNAVEFMVDEEEKAKKLANIDKMYAIKLREEESLSKINAEKERKKSDMVDKVIKILGIAATTATGILAVVLPLKHYDRNFIAGLEYEKTGVISSNTVKGLFNKQNPYK